MNSHQSIIKDTFYELYEEISTKGHLSDDFLLSMGIAADANYAHTKVYHTSTSETYQRSKSLSHSYQRNLRILATRKVLDSKKGKVDKAHQKLDDIHKLNTIAVSKLLSYLPRPHEKIPLHATTMIHLHSINVPELKAFIHARQFDTANIPCSSKIKFPNKGSIVDANEGVPCLLQMTFDCRTSPILLLTTSGQRVASRQYILSVP